MNTPLFQDKVAEIFVAVDDFCLLFEEPIKQHLISEGSDIKRRSRKASLCDSEVIALLISFHSGGFSNFKFFYIHYACVHLTEYFPGLVSYNRFIELSQRCAVAFMLFLHHCCRGECTGISFIDSTVLRVCHNKRIRRNKTFEGIAQVGKSSMGWFYGFKLHLVINDKGEILSFYLSRANVDDRNAKAITLLTEKLFGKLFGDKGYISKALTDMLFGNGIQLITAVRRNMKDKALSNEERLLLRKRAVIETVNDELKSICHVEHTRHRSLNGFLLNLMSAIAAYSFFPKKPSIRKVVEETNPKLIAAFNQQQQLALCA